MKKIKEEYLKKDEKVKKEKEKIEIKMRKLENELNDLSQQKKEIKTVHWIDEIVEPLAQELAKELNKEYGIYGPFGLRSAVTIYLMEDKSISITKQATSSITIIPGDLTEGELFYETGEISGKFGKGTLGYINGMNNELAKLPDSFDEILRLLNHIEKDGELSE